MDALLELAIWVFILAAVGLFTWVRKVFEKMQKGEKTEGKGVGAAVRNQIEKYVKALEESPMGRGLAAPPTLERGEERGAAPPPKRPKPPRPMAPAEPVKPVAPAKPVAVKAYRRLKATEAALVSRTAGRTAGVRLEKRNVRHALLLAELLGPPVAEREHFRLF